MKTPDLRIRCVGDRAARADGHYVLYWMTASRRGEWNFGLQRAVEWARELQRPLLVLEALRCGYRWASDRMHAFLIQGMQDNAAFFGRKRVLYYPYVEPEPDGGKGLLRALAAQASVVISDDFPCSFLPRMYEAAGRQIAVRFELVDSNGLLPLRATEKVFARAFDFRRFLQGHLPEHLDVLPEPDPLARHRLPQLRALPQPIRRRWPPADPVTLGRGMLAALRRLPIDHAVSPSFISGGAHAAQRALRDFAARKLPLYAEQRNEPELDATSGLSPFLHCGHISAHQVFAEVTARQGWSMSQLAGSATGSARGWWGASEALESFLDELITWRELGYNMCAHRRDYDSYESLPAWSLETLRQHASDPREYVYSREQFERAATHDPLWNAAQTQLAREGRIHNYLRMLWGKKVLEWSVSPREALGVLTDLNNKYALDGRDPNSYSGIFWCLGRYDRAWGPERPVFGKVRFMSSANTARKVRVRGYLEKFASRDA